MILCGGGAALACGDDGRIEANEDHGLFVDDTRVLSTWRIAIEGVSWRMLGSERPDAGHAEFHFQNPAIRVPGAEIAEGRIHLVVRREVFGGLSDRFELRAFGREPLPPLRLELLLDADFADVFEVNSGSVPARPGVARRIRSDGVTLRWRRGKFRRAVHLRFDDLPTAAMAGSRVVVDLHLVPGTPRSFGLDVVTGPRTPAPRTAGPAVGGPLGGWWRAGVSDLDRLTTGEGWIAAGAPWFMTLFGRDSLVVSLMTGLLPPARTVAALEALAGMQAQGRDDFRDAEPGKLPHELRRGELAVTGAIPHTPYYGTHDAPALFVLALHDLWRWTGDRALLDRFLPAARAALEWCATLGDRDGDGFLEYGTRSRRGLRNQAWKDSDDAIVDENGLPVEPPVALVEVQGYWFAALRAMAELREAAGEDGAGERAAAEALRRRVEARFWTGEGYAVALDREKRPVHAATSNPGHLLWCGLPSPERARRVAERLFAEDLHSGWGVRTLSTGNPAYNPLAYQLGSVWPHDNALFAAGLRRYGMRAQAAEVLRGLFDAAGRFGLRLPELFSGLPRDGPPVPYERANAPQAWASAVPVLAVQLLLGLVPDAPHARCRLDPFLPDWLPDLSVHGVGIGRGTLDVALTRDGCRVQAHGDLAVERG